IWPYARRISGCTPRTADTTSVPRIANNKLTANASRLPTKVSSKTRTGMPYQCAGWSPRLALIRVLLVEKSATALVQNGEFKPSIGRENFRNFAKALGQCGRSKQGIIAFPQIVIVHIQIKREQVNRDCVREGGFEIFGLVAFGIRAIRGRQFPRLP